VTGYTIPAAVIETPKIRDTGSWPAVHRDRSCGERLPSPGCRTFIGRIFIEHERARALLGQDDGDQHRSPTVAAATKAPVGTTFTFAVRRRATTKLVFTQRNKVKVVLSMAAKAGNDKVKFQGRLSRKHRLAPGRYTVTITAATNANHTTSLRKKLSFTIVRRETSPLAQRGTRLGGKRSRQNTCRRVGAPRDQSTSLHGAE
jgi:hypothetical protein